MKKLYVVTMINVDGTSLEYRAYSKQDTLDFLNKHDHEGAVWWVSKEIGSSDRGGIIDEGAYQ